MSPLNSLHMLLNFCVYMCVYVCVTFFLLTVLQFYHPVKHFELHLFETQIDLNWSHPPLTWVKQFLLIENVWSLFIIFIMKETVWDMWEDFPVRTKYSSGSRVKTYISSYTYSIYSSTVCSSGHLTGDSVVAEVTILKPSLWSFTFSFSFTQITHLVDDWFDFYNIFSSLSVSFSLFSTTLALLLPPSIYPFFMRAWQSLLEEKRHEPHVPVSYTVLHISLFLFFLCLSHFLSVSFPQFSSPWIMDSLKPDTLLPFFPWSSSSSIRPQEVAG